MDYIIADKNYSKGNEENFYSEKVDCIYQRMNYQSGYEI